jgi:hypothetical protein
MNGRPIIPHLSGFGWLYDHLIERAFTARAHLTIPQLVRLQRATEATSAVHGFDSLQADEARRRA